MMAVVLKTVKQTNEGIRKRSVLAISLHLLVREIILPFAAEISFVCSNAPHDSFAFRGLRHCCARRLSVLQFEKRRAMTGAQSGLSSYTSLGAILVGAALVPTLGLFSGT